MTELMIMTYITMEELLKMSENWKKPDARTPEEIAKMKELGEKVKKLSPQDRREMRTKLDEENGYC